MERREASAVEVVVVDSVLVRAFARGELNRMENEAMQAFLADHPDLARQAERIRRAHLLATYHR